MEYICLTKEQLKDHLSDFCALYRKCFAGYIDEEIVKQRYIEHPSDDLLMCVAMDNGKIVANYAAIPICVRAYGEPVKSAIAINSMTSPEYAGRGVYTRLATMLYQVMEEKGYAFVYSFPNNLANKTLTTRLGWKDIYEIPTLEYMIDPLSKKRVRDNAFFSCNIDEIVSLDIPDKIHVQKDAAYIKWRYIDIPDRQYHAAKNQDGDWFLFKRYDSIINVVEYRITSEKSAEQMCDYLANIAPKENVTSITLWASMNTSQHYWMEKCGFVNKAPVRYFAAKQLAPLKFDMFDYRLWYIAMGDDNVY